MTEVSTKKKVLDVLLGIGSASYAIGIVLASLSQHGDSSAAEKISIAGLVLICLGFVLPVTVVSININQFAKVKST